MFTFHQNIPCSQFREPNNALKMTYTQSKGSRCPHLPFHHYFLPLRGNRSTGLSIPSDIYLRISKSCVSIISFSCVTWQFYKLGHCEKLKDVHKLLIWSSLFFKIQTLNLIESLKYKINITSTQYIILNDKGFISANPKKVIHLPNSKINII